MTNITVSERGQIVIPKAIRSKLGIERGQVLEVDEVEGAIVMRPQGRSKAGRVAPRNWQAWRGVLAGTAALQELEAEHSRELKSGR
jgi:AbrB family looped-hinge helix DNA binding protein